MSELPINQPDEIDTLLTEIVAERGPGADEERAHEERVVTILTNARTRASAAIDAARAEARAQNNPNALSEQQESADPADGLAKDERAAVEIVRSRRRSKDALADIIRSAQTREAQITPEGEN